MSGPGGSGAPGPETSLAATADEVARLRAIITEVAAQLEVVAASAGAYPYYTSEAVVSMARHAADMLNAAFDEAGSAE